MSLYVGDVGAELTIETDNTGLPGTDTIYLMIEKPGGSTSEWSLGVGDSLTTATGIIKYYTKLSSELSERGEYKIQLRRVTVSGKQTKSDVGHFTVLDPIF